MCMENRVFGIFILYGNLLSIKLVFLFLVSIFYVDRAVSSKFWTLWVVRALFIVNGI